MILDGQDLELVLYTYEQIVEMIDGLKGNEWDEVLKLDKLPPLPVDPAKDPALKDPSLKDPAKTKTQPKTQTKRVRYDCIVKCNGLSLWNFERNRIHLNFFI